MSLGVGCGKGQRCVLGDGRGSEGSVGESDGDGRSVAGGEVELLDMRKKCSEGRVTSVVM